MSVNLSLASTISLCGRSLTLHLGSSGQWDIHQHGTDPSVTANKWAEPVGLVGNRMVRER